MNLLAKVVTGIIVSIGTEILTKKLLPAALKKSKKALKDLEEKAELKEKGE